MVKVSAPVAAPLIGTFSAYVLPSVTDESVTVKLSGVALPKIAVPPVRLSTKSSLTIAPEA